MTDEAAAEPTLFASYHVQDTRYGKHVFRPWRLASGCILLAFAALFGWAVFFAIPGWPRALMSPSYPLVPSALILILVFLAAFRNEPGWVYLGAVVGLIFLGFPTLATGLCALALVVIRRVETAEPVSTKL